MLLEEEGLDERVRAPRPPRRGDAPRGARLGPRDPVRSNPREYSSSLTAVLMPAGHDADRAAQGRSSKHFDMSLGTGLGKIARQGVPHRPPRRLQRSHADGHAGRRRDGPRARRRAAQEGRRAGGDGHISPRATRNQSAPQPEAQHLRRRRRMKLAEIAPRSSASPSRSGRPRRWRSSRYDHGSATSASRARSSTSRGQQVRQGRRTRRSKGKVEVKVFHSSQLGSDEQMIKGIRVCVARDGGSPPPS